MARADLLVNLVKAGSKGDQTGFTRAVEGIISEERENRHHILADRLASVARLGKETLNRPSQMLDNGLAHLLEHRTAEKQLSELFLSDDNLNAIREVVEEQHREKLLKSYSMVPRNRLMFIGPPGNGKTCLAEALASQLYASFLVVRYEGLIGSFLGETASRLRKIFAYARQHRCVLFFDEFDVIGKERGDIHETGEIKRVVSSLLMQIDSMPSYTVVVVASNHAQLLDSAVWRRFQVRIEMPRPTQKQLISYIDNFAKQTSLNLGLAASTIAKKVAFDSFSAVEDFCHDVYRRAVLNQQQQNAKAITQSKINQWRTQLKVTDNVNSQHGK